MSELAKLKNLHHFAWKCANVDETIAFYEGILGLPYVHKIEKDHVPSTGQYAPYKHVFFELADKSNIAFFDVGDGKGASVDCDDWIVHFAFEVDNTEDVDDWYKKLTDSGIDVIGPTNHDDWIYSIYFFDPNGLRLEITTRLT
ncbi:uncharacterized protein METZ01_LOCUS187774 [marine metagenome]|jgi:catechol 2,3-dioxygenase-like lactoylglutathione lyase family enzyme|uniref:VOC domain-containing protein n=1 Tax=marine metagenome TaxID=408172 RepID=A0A382D905_9ZZZZ|tara:strand:+ start:22 stop:450 length:429 start_codon:yes stop_codon:yes gene_type:complete